MHAGTDIRPPGTRRQRREAQALLLAAAPDGESTAQVAARVAAARRGLTGAAADTAERQAIRQLNTEVAVTVSRLTGLNP